MGGLLKTSRESRFQSLYETHVERIARYTARRISANDVQDVVAETFLTAWRRLDDVPDDAVPWLFGTARKHIANRHRSTRRHHALQDKLTTRAGGSGPQQSSTELTETDKRVLNAIRQLPDAEREAFMLVAWDGLDPRRAAQAVGCSAATFRVRLHRARRRLRKEVVSHNPLGTSLRDVHTPMEESL